MICRLNCFTGVCRFHCPFCGAAFEAGEETGCIHLAYVVGFGEALQVSERLLEVVPDIDAIDSQHRSGKSVLERLRSASSKAQNFVEFEITGASDIWHIAFDGDAIAVSGELR